MAKSALLMKQNLNINVESVVQNMFVFSAYKHLQQSGTQLESETAATPNEVTLVR
jgi:hypothetical protein